LLETKLINKCKITIYIYIYIYTLFETLVSKFQSAQLIIRTTVSAKKNKGSRICKLPVEEKEEEEKKKTKKKKKRIQKKKRKIAMIMLHLMNASS